VACYIWYSEEGPGRATSPSSPLLAIPNVTPHPSTASVPNSYYLMRHYNYLCTLKPGTHWQQSRTRHSGDKNHGALLTKSTELNKFNCGDNADRDKLSNLTSSPVCMHGQQSQNFMNINEDRLVKPDLGFGFRFRPPSATVVSAEPFSHGTGTLRCLQKEMKWQLTDTDLCPCGETQTMSHIVGSCPLTKLDGGLSRLHSADGDAVTWLTNYGK